LASTSGGNSLRCLGIAENVRKFVCFGSTMICGVDVEELMC
jgi:hypothetical protein